MADRALEKGQQEVEKVPHQAHTVFKSLQERAPINSRQVLGLITLLALGTVVLVLGGLTITGTILTLLALTPVLILASPVLIPIAVILFFTVGGLLFAGGAALAAFSSVSWLYNYVKGRHPPGSDQLEAARNRLSDTAAHVKERAREYGSYLQNKPQEVAPGA